MATWLILAAERRELQGILRRAGKASLLPWPGADFAREVAWREDSWWLVASGPGPRLVQQALREPRTVDGILSIGFCGALDPALRIGDIVVTGEIAGMGAPHMHGRVLSVDRVAVTAGEKRTLRETTGASVIEMESAAAASKAREWGVPFGCIRSVSDTAEEDLPLDFNLYRDPQGRFSRMRIALAALGRPHRAIPGLLRLERNCRLAAESLGEFLANSQI
jgi:adenosylhomocysteine nucleosidase